MKKLLLSFFLVLAASAVNAQIVDIPDGYFKNHLLSLCDANSDGEVQASEALTVTTLQVDLTAINGVQGIEAFTNVINLQVISPNGINSYYPDDSTFDFSVLPNVENLYVETIEFDSLDLSPLTNLKILYIDQDMVYYQDIPTVNTLTFGYHPQLQELTIDGYYGFDSIDFSAFPNLEYLNYNNYDLTSLDLSVCPKLEELHLQSFTVLETVNMGNNTHLTIFDFVAYRVMNLDLSGCPNISNLMVTLTYLDTMFQEDLDVSVNLKNGNPNYSPNSYLTINNGTNYTVNTYVCVDEGEESNFNINQYNINQPANTLVVNSFCEFNPGGDNNTITGSLTFDADNDGCEATDVVMQFANVLISDGTTGSVSNTSSGTYHFATQAGTFTLTPQFENNWFTVTPATVTFTDTNNNIATQNFCVTSSGVHNDAEVVVVPLGQAQAGFDAVYKIVYKNKGNQTLSGDITLTFNDAVLDFVSASPAVTISATGSLGWAYTNLLPFEGREILVSLNVNSPAESPAVNIGDVLTYSVGITPLTGDENPFDNTFNLKQTVTGSFDPNDITCLEGATVNPDRIGEYLHYNVNFENTGTAPATFVVVNDMVDLSKFDINSLQVIGASHSLETRVTDNKIEFIFDDINLAANGKGNVTFKIKSLNSLAVNSSVSQQADIIFDFNLPVTTNVATTTYTLLGTTGFGKDALVKVYPNPAANVVSITADSAIQSIQLFDVQGRLLEALTVNDVAATLDIASRAKGIYFIKIATEKGATVEKLIKE
jgi:Secretion system C-terminal sorting domain